MSALTPYITYIKIAMVAIIFAGGVGLGIHLEQPKIAALNQTIGASKVTVQNLTASIAQSNKAIEDNKAAEAARAKSAQDALDAAKLEAKTARATAARILAQRPPKGVNECTAAQAAFDAELRAERAK